MSEELPEDQAGEQTPAVVDELSVLKSRAKIMGIVFSNNIGLDTLRTKINAKLSDTEEESEDPPSKDDEPGAINANPLESLKPKRTLRQFMIQEELKLVRLRITNLDPKKKDLPGEIFTVANEYLGNIRKFIPFGEVTDNGYHVPHCIYTMLKDRKFLHIRTRKSSNGGIPVVEHNWVKEFALEVLPPLTPKELATLAANQAAAGTFALADQQ